MGSKGAMKWAIVLSIAAQSSAFLQSYPSNAPVFPKKLTSTLCSKSAWPSTTSAQRRAIVIAAPLVLLPSARSRADDDVSRTEPYMQQPITMLSRPNTYPVTTRQVFPVDSTSLERMHTVQDPSRPVNLDDILMLPRNGLLRHLEYIIPMLRKRHKPSCTTTNLVDKLNIDAMTRGFQTPA
jgi:hypothetical protein